MDIYAKLLQHKNSLAAALAISLGLVLLLVVMTRFSSILMYFWPLFLSTALVLAAIVFIGQLSPMPRDFSGEREGEAFFEYVAGHPELMSSYQ